MTGQPSDISAGSRALSVFAYAAFWAVAGWSVAFLADLRFVATVDTPTSASTTTAVVVDLALLLLFAVHHSVMARATVKQRLARLLPAPIERSMYVLGASACLALVFWQWRSMTATVWRVDAQPWVAVLWTIYALSWVIVVGATVPTDHLEFFGLRQGGWFRRGWPPGPTTLAERSIYAWVRHPMMFGLLLAFWVTPHMSAGHLLFAVAGSGYIAVGVHFEESDLRRQYGDAYRAYASRVPAVIPRPPRPTAARGWIPAGDHVGKR